MVPREAKTAAILDMEGPADIEQPLTGRYLIKPTDLIPKHTKAFDVPLVEPFHQVVDLAWHGHADAMTPLKPWEDPTPGRPRRRLVALVRHRLPLARPWVVHAALRHGIDQQRSGHDHQQPLHPTGFFHTQRRDTKPRLLEKPKAPLGRGLTFVGGHHL
jgi:hypothetical protein